MGPNEREVEEYVLGLMKDLSQDWDYSQPLTPETRIFTDLGFESLDAVVLGTTIQDHYKRRMPFGELLARLGEEERDLTVAELVAFVADHMSANAEETR